MIRSVSRLLVSFHPLLSCSFNSSALFLGMTDILGQLTRATRQVEHAQRGLTLALDDRREILEELHRLARNLLVETQGRNENLFPSSAQLERFFSWLSGNEEEILPFQHSLLDAGIPLGEEYDAALNDARPLSSPRRVSEEPVASTSQLVEEAPTPLPEQSPEDKENAGVSEAECASLLTTDIAVLSEHSTPESSVAPISEDEDDELASE